ncbi:hypothetical protein F5Y05DRAFT_213712 [Hypoxylon sp. FL0543]|nr:hypothetical protein F5Y05DRAFT_213712 [Hypoxylon sp. FL0543]
MARPGETQSSTTNNHTSSTASTSTSAFASPATSVRARNRPVAAAEEKAGAGKQKSGDGPASSGDGTTEDYTMPSWTARNRWIVFAVASGACAAFNGVFAKLTTNELSTHIAQGISRLFGLTNLGGFVEVVVRAAFFGLNLVFNGVMWSLFTQALAKGNSTTQVSIMNTSTNFMITALLGLIIFSESLPPLWWVGAVMLVAGNVIIGRGKQEEGEEAATGSEETEYHDGVDDDDDHDAVSAAELGRGFDTAARADGVLPVEKDDEDEDVALLGDLS